MDENTRRELIQKAHSLNAERVQRQGLQKCLVRIIHFLLQQKTVKPYHAQFYREALFDVLQQISDDMSLQDMAEKPGDLYFLCNRMCTIELPEDPPGWFMELFSLSIVTKNGVYYDVDWDSFLARLA